jgi:hypothetical protein
MPDPEPTYSLAALARSWAEITGEAWESVLYRLGDWAITDAFPDEAFLSADARDTTIDKGSIFDRVRWYRELVDKIRRVQDSNDKARLQKFADLHMQAVEIAVLRRDVVVEACRAMHVAPPPILGPPVDVSAKHRVPPECPPDFPVGVFDREAERDRAWRRHGEVMAPDETDKYTLLWDAARETSRNNERGVEWNWLRLMDAFWRGDLAPDGLTCFYPAPPAGRECVVLDRRALGEMLLGHRTLNTGTASIDDLRNWRVADYRDQPAPFGGYFEPDPEGRVGFAVRTRELQRWREHSPRAGRHPRKTKSEEDLRVRNQIEAVLAAHRRRWPDPATRPAVRQQARILHTQLRNTRPPLRLSEESIRQILSGKYGPMIRMGIGPVGPDEAVNVTRPTT